MMHYYARIQEEDECVRVFQLNQILKIVLIESLHLHFLELFANLGSNTSRLHFFD